MSNIDIKIKLDFFLNIVRIRNNQFYFQFLFDSELFIEIWDTLKI